jgi:hypothetical protein
MAQYPVADAPGIIEGVNYLLSGPTGLGQNFDGFNSIEPAYITSYFRAPFAFTVGNEPTPESILWYSAPLNIGNITPINSRSFEVTFDTPQPSPPYSIGQGLFIQGVNPTTGGIVSDAFTPTGTKILTTEVTTFDSVIPTTVTGTGTGAVVEIILEASPSEPYSLTGSYNLTVAYINRGTGYDVGDTLLIPGNLIGGTSPANDLTLVIDEVTNNFNGYWTPPGVVTCSTTSVIVQANSDYDFPAYVSGGTIQLDANDAYASTDANGRVSVFGPGDKVFVSAQIFLDWNYDCNTDTDQEVTVAINRYTAFLDTTDPLNKDFLFDQRTTISSQTRSYPVSTGIGGESNQEFVFTTIIDSPSSIKDGEVEGYGYYWYILEVYFDSDSGSVYTTDVTANLRSLTAQVIKQ